MRLIARYRSTIIETAVSLAAVAFVGGIVLAIGGGAVITLMVMASVAIALILLVLASDRRERRAHRAPPLGFSDTYSVLHDKAEKPDTTVVIDLHAPERLPLAMKLESVVAVAEWEVRLNTAPIGPGPETGVVVSGRGRQYVEPVAEALRNDRLPDVVADAQDPGDEMIGRAARMAITIAIGPEAKPRRRRSRRPRPQRRVAP